MNKITVKYGLLKKVVNALDETNPTEDTDVSFEYIVGSCFPNIYDNIKKKLYSQYTQGYLDGLQEGRENNEEKNP